VVAKLSRTESERKPVNPLGGDAEPDKKEWLTRGGVSIQKAWYAESAGRDLTRFGWGSEENRSPGEAKN